MNELGISLLWLVGRVTLLCLVTAAIYFVARRRHPAAGATAALTGLLLSMALTCGLVIPWPRWSLQDASTDGNESAAVTTMDEPEERSPTPETEQVDDVSVSGLASDQPPDVELESRSAAAWNAFWKGLGTELTQPRPSHRETGFRWSGWVAVALLIAMALGAARLLAGWIGVQHCVRRSAVIRDRSLSEMLDVLRAELGCRRSVEVRESSDVASAATVGWRKPLILLPRGWREWSDRERRAVLAHELAHVTAGDAATWLAAQFGLLLHFYHPLVHWLTHRLRLEQELAADALAARLTGSSQTYLTTLAELAVRQPDRPAQDWIGAWPARAFLPTRGTLLRRIEMLRDTKTPPLRSSTLRRATVIALTLAAALFVAGLRPPERQQAMAQQDRPPAEDRAKPQASAEGGFNLENVPASTKLLIGLRPSKLATRLEMQSLVEVLGEAVESERSGIHFQDIDQLLVTFTGQFDLHTNGQIVAMEPDRGEPVREPMIELRMKRPTDFAAFATWSGAFTIDEWLEIKFKDQPELLVGEKRRDLKSQEMIIQQFLMAVSQLDDQAVVYQVDNKTVLYGVGMSLMPYLVHKYTERSGKPSWLERFESVATDDFCFVCDVAEFRQMIRESFNQRPNPVQGMFVPLWENTDLVIGGVKIEDRLSLTLNGWTSDAEAAAKVEQTLTSLVPLARGMLESVKASFKEVPDEFQRPWQRSLGVAEQALDDVQIKTEDDRVTVSVEADAGSVATLAAAIVPAVQQAREGARRTQTRNNLKQIGLAFHNYHNVYGHFPPPVLYGQGNDGTSKHPHSWRVAILPYLDEADLYTSYQFDEPWDSEQNLKVAAQMPAVFRSPNGDPDSANTAYYVLVGDNTAVGTIPEPDGQPTKGVPMNEFKDGTSNTILVVEAKRDIPWTKPEDIPYSPDEDLPELGGWHAHGFHAIFADGSARFIAEAIDAALLRALITRNGGEVIDLNEF